MNSNARDVDVTTGKITPVKDDCLGTTFGVQGFDCSWSLQSNSRTHSWDTPRSIRLSCKHLQGYHLTDAIMAYSLLASVESLGNRSWEVPWALHLLLQLDATPILENTWELEQRKHVFSLLSVVSVIAGKDGFRACRHIRLVWVSFSFDHKGTRLYAVSSFTP